ncbi:AAA family ATPase [Streptococcus uberis]|uniref:McrB family protein n=1 Tax=Streptococcus uberis TaxID=1349 RepID=UPI001FF62AC8|nr:AAA family ATPase [Streptococcus uberis]MCK1230235.1 AAA family ATPase [Streptococcus uberis]
MSSENLYFVGAHFGGQSQLSRFKKEGIWELGWQGDEKNKQYIKMASLLNKIEPGDPIIIKSTFTKKYNLPFNNPNNNYYSVMRLSARGKVIENIGDGHTLKVEWEENFNPKDWYFYTGRETIWQVKRDTTLPEVNDLINFALNDHEQNYQIFLKDQDNYVATNDEVKEVSLDNFYMWFEEHKDVLLQKAREGTKENSKLQEDFLKDWPLEKLASMTLDDYVIGKGAENNSFCYQLEFGKYSNLFLGIKGGSSGKFGIYWHKMKEQYCGPNNQVIPETEAEKYFNNLKSELIEILNAGIKGDFESKVFDNNGQVNSFYSRSNMLTKLFCIYSPKGMYSGINMNKNHKEVFDKLYEVKGRGGVYKQNHALTKIISEAIPELNSELLGHILWEYLNFITGETEDEVVSNKSEFINEYSNTLISEKNIIFRGAPGTGKTFLSNQIASDIVSNGRTDKIEELDPEESDRICFVQFHPSYDYSDFVEGLRPKIDNQGNMGFKLENGIFKKFVLKAIENYEKSIKSQEEQQKEADTKNRILSYLDEVNLGEEVFEISSGNKFYIESFSDETIEIKIPGNAISKALTLKVKKLKDILDAGVEFKKGKDINEYFSSHRRQEDSYYFALYHKIKSYKVTGSNKDVMESVKPFVFIIDEINRGEISKIFGELLFSIDPSYRGNKQCVYTQYANMHEEDEQKFYIPKNVYIIGTMNDIDRSVDTFDFAMRRRFTFIEISAEDSANAMDLNDKVRFQMLRLNEAIITIGGLSTDYQIGASYFREIENAESRDECPIWTHKLKPLLRDYFRGETNASSKVSQIESQYFNEG